MITTAWSKDFRCQHPASRVFMPGKVVLRSDMGGSEQDDFSSSTRRVRRKPDVKKYIPAI